MKKHAFGIDLGMTTSSICIFENGHYDIIADKKNQKYIPSAVYYYKKENDQLEISVGDFALKYQSLYPKSIIYDTKRMLGRRYENSSIQNMVEKWPFEIERSENESILIKPENSEKKMEPYEVSGEILKYLIKVGNLRFPPEEQTNDVVITIPANFGDSQRSETLKAADYAKLNVRQIINEPTSAAIAYGIQMGSQATKPSHVFIFDFGGGTLDVSLLSIEKNTFKVIGTDGDMYLGGRDFDEKLCDYLVDKMNLGESFRKDPKKMCNLRKAAVEAKIQLSNCESAVVLFDDNDEEHEYEITNSEFEEVNSEYIEKVLIPVEKILAKTEISIDMIDEVILVGGSSRMQFVKRILTDYFHKEPYDGINPLDAVVSGAAIVAAKIIQGENLPKMINDIKYIDICPFSIGTLTVDGTIDVLIPKDTIIPIMKKEHYHTVLYKQESFVVYIYEGENKYAKDNRHLGNFELKLPPSENEISFIISFSLDANCILSAEARIENTDVSAGIKIDTIKTKPSGVEFKELNMAEVFFENILRFINLNMESFKKEYKKYEIDDMIEEARMKRNQQFNDEFDMMENIKSWRDVMFVEYFQKHPLPAFLNY